MHFFCAKKGVESWQLTPCSDSLRKHGLRANYQGAIWRRCLENNPEVPSPVEHGWSRLDQDGDLQLSIDWFNVSIGPQAVLEFLSCSCKRDCVTPHVSVLHCITTFSKLSVSIIIISNIFTSDFQLDISTN